MAIAHRPRPDNDAGAAPATRRDDRVGPQDMEGFVNLPPEEHRRLADTPGPLDAWRAARPAGYVEARA